MLRELGNSIKAILYDRAVSPLSGVIGVVWIAFNWKPLVVLFWGANDITARITYIEANYVDVWRNLYYPAIWAAVVLVVYPFAALLAYALWEKVDSWKLRLKQQFEGTVTLPISKSLAIWTEMREKDKQFNIAFEAKDNRIAELEKQSGDLSRELANLKESLSKGSTLEVEIAKRTEQLAQAESALRDEKEKRSKREQDFARKLELREAELATVKDRLNTLALSTPKLPDLEEQELKLLTAIADAEEKNMWVEEGDAIKSAGLTRVEGNHYIQSLKSRNYISSQSDTDGEGSYLSLQQPGRAYVIQIRRNVRTPSKAPPPINPVRG